jgi:diphthamide synthase (EF-2-diphthine--ammonia ligase)
MKTFIDEAKQQHVECFAFGDLYLEDIRRYREDRLEGTGITPLFPIWDMPTKELSRTMVSNGLKARITCVDPKQLAAEFAGREYDESFLGDIPPNVDPCGENGEFHSFAFDGPMFQYPIDVSLGGITHRDGFVFADLLPC